MNKTASKIYSTSSLDIQYDNEKREYPGLKISCLSNKASSIFLLSFLEIPNINISKKDVS
jgi:hypothetical protein